MRPDFPFLLLAVLLPVSLPVFLLVEAVPVPAFLLVVEAVPVPDFLLLVEAELVPVFLLLEPVFEELDCFAEPDLLVTVTGRAVLPELWLAEWPPPECPPLECPPPLANSCVFVVIIPATAKAAAVNVRFMSLRDIVKPFRCLAVFGVF